MTFIPPMLCSRLERLERLTERRYVAAPNFDRQRARTHIRKHEPCRGFQGLRRDSCARDNPVSTAVAKVTYSGRPQLSDKTHAGSELQCSLSEASTSWTTCIGICLKNVAGPCRAFLNTSVVSHRRRRPVESFIAILLPGPAPSRIGSQIAAL